MTNEIMNTLLGAILGFIGSLALNHIQNDKRAADKILKEINKLENIVIIHNGKIERMAQDISDLKASMK